MTRFRPFTTYAFALTIVVAQLLCGCITSIGSQTVASVEAGVTNDSSADVPPCHGGRADNVVPDSMPTGSPDCTHCATTSALIADAFTPATPDLLNLLHWPPSSDAAVDMAPAAAKAANGSPPGWHGPLRPETLVSHKILLLI